jgi:hypothetical protein
VKISQASAQLRLPVSLYASAAGTVNVAISALVGPESSVTGPHGHAHSQAGADARRTQNEFRCIEDAQLSLIYLYCHAGGIANPAAFPPYLEFFDAAKGVAEKLTAADLDSASVWTKSPLVMLNGCGTVGFSPDALSPFVVKLVQDRGEAGVLGTEVLVSEPLAEEIATEFLRAFLRGKPAGESLMVARRALLAQHNPLGSSTSCTAPPTSRWCDVTCGTRVDLGDAAVRFGGARP